MVRKNTITFLSILLFVLMASTTEGKIIYVDDNASGTNNGTSWTNAYIYLQDALADANSAEKPVRIHVAQGIYKPDQGAGVTPGDRKATFQLIDGVILKGGYAGFGMAELNIRNIERYKTILNGDLAGDDAAVVDPCDLLTEPTRAENSYTVVTVCPCSEPTALDGFIISSGNAIGPDRHQVHQNGAGLLADCYRILCCPSIKNCTFTNNSAYIGGAVYVIGARPELINCKFLQNAAVQGGAMLTSMWRGPEWDAWWACEFVIRGCIFVGNYARDTGGALYIGAGAPSIIEDSTFTSNSARTGGAMYYSDYVKTIANCRLLHNIAYETGGAIYFEGTGLSMTSCTFFGNVAQTGRAFACLEPWRKGLSAPSATITNTILWDAGDEIGISEHVQVTIRYSNIQGCWPGEGNINADPLFADPGRWDPNGTPEDTNDDIWVDGDYHLKSQAGRWDPNEGRWTSDDVTSLCIDAGDPMSPIGFEPFPNGGIINMGAYGGTTEASKSYFGEPACETIVAGDINGDCKVDFKDFQLMALHWLEDNSP